MTEPVSGPVVFQCGKCCQIIGDTFAFVCATEDRAKIALKAVHAIQMSDELCTSADEEDLGCTFRDCLCNACKAILGKQYVTTTAKLDVMRGLYVLEVRQLKSYQVGTAEVTDGVPDILQSPDMVLIEEMIDTQLTKIRQLLVAFGDRLDALEKPKKSTSSKRRKKE